MTNIDKLSRIGILGDIRLRMGAYNQSDTSCDDEINELDNSQLIEEWFKWKLGDGSWWTDALEWYEQLNEFDKNKQ